MMSELAPLMQVFAEEGDFVWQPEQDGSWGRLLDHSLAEVLSPEVLPEALELSPWALEPHLLHTITQQLKGIYPSLRLIQPKISEAYLRLSHRRSAEGLLRQLIEHSLAPQYLLPRWIEGDRPQHEIEAEIGHWARVYQQQYLGLQALFAKRPFSSSGRGVQPIPLPLEADRVRALAAGCRRSGSLSLEPMLQVLDNWALEYWSDGLGQVSLLGLSHFETHEASGAYRGNILAGEAQLREELEQLVGAEVLAAVVEQHCRLLSHSLGSGYRGYVGVDLFVYSAPWDERPRLHPCVEINLRTTMGVLAHQLYQRYIHPSKRGYYRLLYLSDREAMAEQVRRSGLPPLFDAEGRLYGGHWGLTPLPEGGGFYAYVEIEP